eukprot:433701-Amphidinium_carterae.1
MRGHVDARARLMQLCHRVPREELLLNLCFTCCTIGSTLLLGHLSEPGWRRKVLRVMNGQGSLVKHTIVKSATKQLDDVLGDDMHYDAESAAKLTSRWQELGPAVRHQLLAFVAMASSFRARLRGWRSCPTVVRS